MLAKYSGITSRYGQSRPALPSFLAADDDVLPEIESQEDTFASSGTLAEPAPEPAVEG